MTQIKLIRLLSTSKNSKHLIKNGAFYADIKRLEEEKEITTDVVFISDNREPLTKVYNKFLDESKEMDADLVILIHADVMFNYYDVVKHYLDLPDNKKYNIVGLAGTKKVHLSVSPLTWFTGSREFENERYGRVTHRQFNLGESFFNSRHHPEVKETEVSAIDGLCFIIDKQVLDSGDSKLPPLRFDERFTFDFYDLDFCLTAIVIYHFKVGVIVEPVVHESVGTSILKPQYLDVEKKFREKWKV